MKPIERAKKALTELEEVILDYLRSKPDGAINNEIARELALESDHNGKQKNYLTYSILGGLIKQGRVVRDAGASRKAYRLPER